MISRVLSNPYHKSGSSICKLSVNWMTFIWSVGVLVNKDAIAASSYAAVSTYVHEDVIAAFLFALSTGQTVYLAMHWRPLPFGSLGYLLLLLWWAAVFVLVVFDGRPQPTALMGSSTAALLAWFAYISGPRRGCRALAA